MPPKGAKKKAAAPKLHAEDAEIDEQLLKIDIWGAFRRGDIARRGRGAGAAGRGT
jgi:hypothetical protein